MKVYPMYANNGTAINPDYEQRAIKMLANATGHEESMIAWSWSRAKEHTDDVVKEWQEFLANVIGFDYEHDVEALEVVSIATGYDEALLHAVWRDSILESDEQELDAEWKNFLCTAFELDY